MKNSKGQTLVIFVVFLPIILLLMATIIDMGIMYYNKNQLDNLNMMVIEYGINNFENNNLNEKLNNLIDKNDNKIINKNINIKDNQLEIILEKNIESTFGKVIGLDEYKIKSHYVGTNEKDKKEIKKG